MAKPSQSSMLPDSYVVMARLPRRKPGGLAAEFGSVAEAKSQAADKMVRAIRRLAQKNGATVQIETRGILASGFAKVKCDRYFAKLMRQLPSVYQIEPERAALPPNRGPRFNRLPKVNS
ncbi:MAG TPA: hypothetical protein VEF76_04490 [Patescibacteria group bacterium]|nr:hypothetical protein [Patescibacteria group bacterium]